MDKMRDIHTNTFTKPVCNTDGRQNNWHMNVASASEYLSKAVGKAETEAGAAPAQIDPGNRMQPNVHHFGPQSGHRSQHIVPAHDADDGAAGDNSTLSSGTASRSIAPKTQGMRRDCLQAISRFGPGIPAKGLKCQVPCA